MQPGQLATRNTQPSRRLVTPRCDPTPRIPRTTRASWTGEAGRHPDPSPSVFADIPIVFGGISATLFHRELIEDPAVDFVLRGSVTEPSLLALVRELEGEWRFERVPGLTWKDEGAIRINPDAPLPL